MALIARAFTRPTTRSRCLALVGRQIFRQNNAVPHPLRHFLYTVEELMPKRSIRLTDAIDQRIQSAAKQRGYSTPSAFLRAAIKKELNEPAEGSAANEKILGYIREVRQDVQRVERAQQALFALVDSFAKVFVTCVPEPHGIAMETALAEARKRHARLLTNAGQAMLSDSIVAMEDLISRGQK
jgi:Arc/MetJ-type ribon-helix-helix transcriptional regulator